jgi:hypothetical protein
MINNTTTVMGEALGKCYALEACVDLGLIHQGYVMHGDVRPA